jgi:2-furoyl-CoA dehydrogenase large subunit
MNRLGAKGMGDGCSMIAPAAIANAVADAIGRDVSLPLTPSRVWSAMQGKPDAAIEARSRAPAQRKARAGRALEGKGSVVVNAPPDQVWARLLDPDALKAAIPGCETLEDHGQYSYSARVAISIAGIGGIYDARVRLEDLKAPVSFRLVGEATGGLGFGSGEALVTLSPTGDGKTTIDYSFSADVGGRVASLGHRLLAGATRLLIAQFFARFTKNFGGSGRVGILARLSALFGRGAP